MDHGRLTKQPNDLGIRVRPCGPRESPRPATEASAPPASQAAPAATPFPHIFFAYRLEHGVIPRLGWSREGDPCLCHRCDEASCVNPGHLRLGTNTENRAEWAQRHRNPHGPLADLRGAAGRGRAVAVAVRAGISAGESAEGIEERIRAARHAGQPLTLW
jgi:hypothetical protein